MVRDALDCGASMGKPPFLLGIIIIVEEKMLLDFDGTRGIAPAGATKGHENKRSLRSPFGNLRRTPMLIDWYWRFSFFGGMFLHPNRRFFG